MIQLRCKPSAKKRVKSALSRQGIEAEFTHTINAGGDWVVQVKEMPRLRKRNGVEVWELKKIKGGE